MTKLLTFKLGMRFQHMRQCLVRSRQLELQRPGDQLVSGWTIVEVRISSSSQDDDQDCVSDRTGLCRAYFHLSPR